MISFIILIYFIGIPMTAVFAVRWFRKERPRSPTTLLDVVAAIIIGFMWPGLTIMWLLFIGLDKANNITLLPPRS